jgi:hypothetical protein
MLLPELSLPTSIDLFESNFEYFFYEYVSFEDSPKLTFSKSNISYNGHRYSIYFDEEKPETSQQFLIGEIDAIKVHTNRTDIRAAVYRIQDYKEGLKFFDKFYFMIFAKWEIEFNVELLNCKSGEGATMEWVKIGWATGYFCLPEVYSEMFTDNDCYDDFLKFSPGDLEIYDYLDESVHEDIIEKYEFEINRGLPELSKVAEGILKKSIGASEHIQEIIEQISDHNKDRYILSRWLEGASAKIIGHEIDRSDRTVHNILSTLRKTYGRDIVPRYEDRKK